MKITNKIYAALLLVGALAGCKKEAFVEANISPSTLYEVQPEDQFLAAASGSQDDFEYYYDVYRSLNLWLQYATNAGATGNSLNFTNPSGNFNYRYGKIFYERVGTRLADGIRIINAMPDAEKARRVHQKAIMQIFKAYYAFYVSDINGSIPYTEAFQGRSGGTLAPKYDTQQELFNVLDGEIKAAVNTLKTSQSVPQFMMGTNDPFYGTAADQSLAWAKAGNALRLKIAMRLMKRDPQKLKAIATEVIADPVQMSSIDDSWALYTGASYADANGNFNPDNFYASKPVVDFMLAKKEWYEKGVRASIEYYNKRAVAAQVEGFVQVTPQEIADYLAAPGVAYDPAKATEQIAVQAYLDFFRQPSEAWAWWKRTGYPNTGSVLPWANLTSNGSVLRVPRRASISVLQTTNLNFENQHEALKVMQQETDFGSGPNDAFGRVWWDKQ